MISATLDSNVYVSALIYPGPPARLLAMAQAGLFRVDISEEILDEAFGVLRDKFDWPGYLIHGMREQISGFANKVTPTERLDVVKTDDDDNRIIECAKAAGSDYIISADKHLRRLGSFGNAKILTVPDFMKVLQEQGRGR